MHLRQLITGLQSDPQAAADALIQILHTAASTVPEPEQGLSIEDFLQQWEPAITAIATAAAGDADATAQLTPVLDDLAQENDWAALVAVLRRIINGDRGNALLEGLDPVDAAIATQVLTRLGPPAAPVQEQP